MLYWLYDLPSVLSFILITGFFPAFGVLGLHISKKTFQKRLAYNQDRNDQVSFFMSVLGIFYGITLGLVAVGAWENFESVQDQVIEESASVAALYRDIRSFPEPDKSRLANALEKYVSGIIEEEWPIQKEGGAPEGGLARLSVFQDSLYRFRPSNVTEEILFTEAIGKFNDLVKLRRLRLMTVGNGLPGTVWQVTLIGALATISFFWFFVMENYHMQIILTAIVAFFIGSMIFLIVMMDNPYNGEISVSSDCFEMVRNQLMK